MEHVTHKLLVDGYVVNQGKITLGNGANCEIQAKSFVNKVGGEVFMGSDADLTDLKALIDGLPGYEDQRNEVWMAISNLLCRYPEQDRPSFLQKMLSMASNVSSVASFMVQIAQL